ncbi:AcrR family transcriptional regulator [Inquilinus ginsengisoli]|uniref:DUF4158 domain-containing protein n=1 Tax=Inquilinus ginsengisoli TaxID=363840 RepID=UPI003D21EE02
MESDHRNSKAESWLPLRSPLATRKAVNVTSPFPGRLLRPGEVVPREVLAFVAGQLDVDPDTLAAYAVRSPTRYDQLEALRATYGFRTFTQPDQREMAKWLLPVALATTSGVALASLLLQELRRRAIAAPGPSVIERLVAAALLQAERHVERQVDAGLSGPQRDALESLLKIHPDSPLSTLAWTRQVPGSAGHRALARLIDQLTRLRALAIDPVIIDGVRAGSPTAPCSTSPSAPPDSTW